MAKAGSIVTVAAALLAGSVAAASAADLPVKAPFVAPVVAAYDWSGWYAGVGIGGLSADSRWTFFRTPAVPDIFPGTDQAMAGVHGGYQWHFKTWQNGGIVVGMEYAGQWDLSENRGGVLCPNITLQCQLRLESLYTIGGKLGLTWDRFMVYGSGGWAGGVVNTFGTPLAGGPLVSQAHLWHNGWYAGAGIDWVFYQTRGTDWIIGAEYQHIEYDTTRHLTLVGFASGDDRDVRVTADYVKAKLTVKLNGPYWFFGGAAPVVAKY
jgi:outer membrane immunogenic protein